VQFYNLIDSTINLVDDTRLTAVVPVGATTGKISVTKPCGTTQTATDFTVDTIPPTVHVTSPAWRRDACCRRYLHHQFDADDNDSVSS